MTVTPQDAPPAAKPQDCVDHEWDEIWDMIHAEPLVLICRRCGWRRGNLVASWQPESTPQDCRHSFVEFRSLDTWKIVYRKCCGCGRLDTRGSWQRTT